MKQVEIRGKVYLLMPEIVVNGKYPRGPCYGCAFPRATCDQDYVGDINSFYSCGTNAAVYVEDTTEAREQYTAKIVIARMGGT
jgi:hypothetical protein